MKLDEDSLENTIQETLPHGISASRIHAWMFCSRSHQLKYDLCYPGITGPAAKVGVKMHDRIAQALQDGSEPRLPRKWLSSYKDMCQQLQISDNLLVEKQLLGQAQGEYILGYLDVIDLDQCFILDWKTGKVHGYPVQAYIYSMLVDQLLGEPLPMYYAYIRHDKLIQVTKDDLIKGRRLFHKFVDRDDRFLPCFNGGANKCLKCSYRMPCAAVCQGI
jgi:hypothetical protein